MTNIEECECLLSAWKADMCLSKEKGLVATAEAWRQRIYGLESALGIFKRPSNLENATDALQCPECEQNGESGMNFCANCGRQLWHR